jgi:predicted ATP-dependent endonuclease of OLD family
MEVAIRNEGKDIRIWSTKDEEGIHLQSSETESPLIIPIIPRVQFPTAQAREQYLNFYREQEALNSSHPVMALLRRLPTPMFLNIERRFEDLYEIRPSRLVRTRSHNVFSSSLTTSLLEAANLAEEHFRGIQAKQIELRDNLRKKFLLTTIQYQDPSKVQLTLASFPKLTPQYLDSKQFQITSILSSLGLEEIEISNQLEPLFDTLKKISIQYPSGFDFLDESTKLKNEEGSVDVDLFKTLSEWLGLKPQFERIEMISRHADDYVRNSARLNRQLNKYLETVNQFLADSGKELVFSPTGTLRVAFEGSQTRAITSLSSGESQIVVILTHLTFNPAAHKANVFIVDEPELSLHVRWQELFVTAIREAAPQLQIILATHSPSIILEEVEHCVDLSRRTSGDNLLTQGS